MKQIIFILFLISITSNLIAQNTNQDSIRIEKLRTESGVDPTRVQSRIGYSILVQDLPDNEGIITNRASLTMGVNRWSLGIKAETVTRSPEIAGTGFKSGFGDIRFNVLNAFFVKDKHALAANAEFAIPTGGQQYGSGYFSVTPALTYSYTINSTLFLAFQPQYTFQLMKDPLYPDLSVITIRCFLAKFTKSGMFFVFEPRPVFDLTNNKTDFVLSPIIGKSLGGGYNLIALAEIATTNNLKTNRGQVYQFGFNKNF
jgi:hypothetical protein